MFNLILLYLNIHEFDKQKSVDKAYKIGCYQIRYKLFTVRGNFEKTMDSREVSALIQTNKLQHY